MKEPCIIKSYPHGLLLNLNPNVDFETVIMDICGKFAASREFFGATHLVLGVEGRQLSAEETEAVIQAIEYNSDVRILLISENDKLRDTRMVGKMERYYYDRIEENATIVPRSIERGETIVSDQSMVIIGDVEPEAIVHAAGNIIVCGQMYGSVCAGKKNRESSYIAAVQPMDALVSIGDVQLHIEAPRRSLFRRARHVPKFFYLEDGEIVSRAFPASDEEE